MFIIVKRKVQAEGPDDWEPVRDRHGFIPVFPDEAKAAGVMKVTHFHAWRAGNVKVIPQSENVDGE